MGHLQPLTTHQKPRTRTGYLSGWSSNGRARPARLVELTWTARGTRVLAWRNIVGRLRQPASLADVTIQPVVYLLLLGYVFGPAIALPAGVSYRDYLVTGLFAATMAGAMPGTAVGLSADIESGFVERLRSMPTARGAVLIGRTVADVLTNSLGVAVVALGGFATGWRISANPGDVVAAVALILLFGYAMSWVGVLLATLLRNAEAAQSLGLVVVLPMTFLSNSFLPTDSMPQWFRTVVSWNPMSSVVTATRSLLLANMHASGGLSAWTMRYPVLSTLAWSGTTLLIAIPIATRLFWKRGR